MGFSLTIFFQDLQEIINNDDINEQDKLTELKECIEDAEKYSKECGQI
jgi:hypothetical protein